MEGPRPHCSLHQTLGFGCHCVTHHIKGDKLDDYRRYIKPKEERDVGNYDQLWVWWPPWKVLGHIPRCISPFTCLLPCDFPHWGGGGIRSGAYPHMFSLNHLVCSWGKQDIAVVCHTILHTSRWGREGGQSYQVLILRYLGWVPLLVAEEKRTRQI
jgi:hypothetical protein